MGHASREWFVRGGTDGLAAKERTETGNFVILDGVPGGQLFGRHGADNFRSCRDGLPKTRGKFSAGESRAGGEFRIALSMIGLPAERRDDPLADITGQV